MIDPTKARYLEARTARSEERTPRTLENNKRFFEQFNGRDLDIVKQAYNYVIRKVNWQGRHYTVGENLSESETQDALTRKLTEFQDGIDNLDSIAQL